jgi:hypothetical protein
MSPQVVAVGGTPLHFTTKGRFKNETGWVGSGGGCSKYETASAAQAAFAEYQTKGCAGKRAGPDLAADAVGVAVYDSQPTNGKSGWFVTNGTNISSPLIAARAAGAWSAPVILSAGSRAFAAPGSPGPGGGPGPCPPCPSGLCGPNLIVNGDAEVGAGANSDIVVRPIPGWNPRRQLLRHPVRDRRQLPDAR